MIKTEEIQSTLDRYLKQNPGEAEHVRPLTEALASGADVTSRSEFNGGHVTCGAVVIDGTGRLLLIEHKTLKKWLLPGGHLEAQDAGLLHAALRELEEETGISWHGVKSPPGHDITPVDIDVHGIPANPNKGEPAHWHADLRFVFRVQDPKIRLQAEEVDGYAWRPCDDAPTTKLAAKIKTL